MTAHAYTTQTISCMVLLLAACAPDRPLSPEMDRLARGTWGGENIAVIVSDSTVHVHIGCTKGDFPAPVLLDGDGRFTVDGSYILRAHPIQVGPPLPAQLAGVVSGGTVIFSIAVSDTTPVALGPAVAVYGRDPRMGPCPVCVNGNGMPVR
jgi:hypothetical protein